MKATCPRCGKEAESISMWHGMTVIGCPCAGSQAWVIPVVAPEPESHAIVSDEYVKLDPRDVLTDASGHIAAALRAAMPSPDDMHAELRREVLANVDGVEFVVMKRMGLAFFLKADAERPYRRSKQYGQVAFDAQTFEDLRPGALVDEVRRRCFLMARMFAGRIVEQVKAFRLSPPGSAPQGASIDYNVGFAAALRAMPVTVRFWPGHLPRTLPMWADEQPRIFASIVSDEVLLRYAAYYAIAPAGEELEPDDT